MSSSIPSVSPHGCSASPGLHLHDFMPWKRKTLHHLKENKVSVSECRGAVAYATWGEHAAAKHSSLQQSWQHFWPTCDKGQCWASRHHGSLRQEQQAVEFTSASALPTELKACWNLELALPEDRSPTCGAAQGDVLVEEGAFLTWRPQPVESLELTAAPEPLCREYTA